MNIEEIEKIDTVEKAKELGFVKGLTFNESFKPAQWSKNIPVKIKVISVEEYDPSKKYSPEVKKYAETHSKFIVIRRERREDGRLVHRLSSTIVSCYKQLTEALEQKKLAKQKRDDKKSKKEEK